MSNLTITNFSTEDGIRGVSTSEQGVITLTENTTVGRITILGRITATGKYGVYASGATDGTEKPIAVSVSEAVSTVAGDYAVGVMLGGEVREDSLIIHGSDPGVGITDAIKDMLRDYGIIVKPAVETLALDNQ